jgi:predicted O-methyltransferase YrrM
MDKYATHIPVLKSLLYDKSKNIECVFEFGTGLHSTKLFLENCSKVTACEMQSEDWYTKVNDEFKDFDNVEVFYMPGPDEAIEYLSKVNLKFDLIFVDGHGDSRWKAINEASKFTDLIVSHDTEEKSYNWHFIDLGDDWVRTDYKEHTPWTTVWRKQ